MRLIVKKSLESTCPERKVCAAFIETSGGSPRILSMATNGVPKKLHYLNGTSYHKTFCVHAEERAFKDLTDKNFNHFPMVSFCNLSPCYSCAKTLSNSPIIAHVYHEDYDDPTGVEFLLDEGIPVYRSCRGKLLPAHPDISLQNSGMIDQMLKRLNSLEMKHF